MTLGLLLLAISSCYIAARRSVSAGVACVLCFGYFNGWIRANYLSVFTTLMFDGALLGFYIAILPSLLKATPRERPELRQWTLVLLLWPTLLMAVPVHDPLIQLLGWRGEVWALPMLLVGAKLQERDLAHIAHHLAVLNIVAALGGLYIYFYGLGALYPRNVITELMYRSMDVAGGHSRIPSIFLSAHGYGGTMVQSLPLLLAGWRLSISNRNSLIVVSLGIIAALAGILMCSAKLPVALLALGSLLSWYRSGLSMRGLLVTFAGFLIILSVAATNPRLQRFFDLQDPELLVGRVYASNNEGVYEIATKYPLGGGMGAGAPSVPFFLADRAPVVPLAENEFVRIIMDLGWPGLGFWLGFLVWILTLPTLVSTDPRRWLNTLCYGFTAAAWCTAVIGVGLLVAIPSNVLLLLQMGVLAQRRSLKGLNTATSQAILPSASQRAILADGPTWMSIKASGGT